MPSLTPGVKTQARRIVARLAADPHVLLAIAIVIAALVIEYFSATDARVLVLPVAIYLGLQIAISLAVAPAARSRRTDTLRLLIALAAVFVMSLQTGAVSSLPLTSLYIPIVAMAAAIGWAPTAVVGAGAMLAYFGPAVALSLGTTLGPAIGAVPGLELIPATPGIPVLLQRGVSLIAATVLLVIGTRRTVGSLERAIERAHRGMNGQRRRARQMAAVEAVGRLLAREGPTSEALDGIMELLEVRFGYRYVSFYAVVDATGAEPTDVDGRAYLQLGAQRGYADPIERFEAGEGILGRVLRTGAVAHIRDVTADPDYRAADPSIRSEISVPLVSADRVTGVLSVESSDPAPLDEADRDALVLVADRVAAALELGRERAALAARAEQFARIADFGARITATLEPDASYRAIVVGVRGVLESDVVSLILRTPGVGDRIVAIDGGDGRFVGVSIPPGEGLAGEAIATRSLVRRDRLDREAYPTTVRGARVADALTGVAIPLIADGEPMGALSLSRFDLERPYSSLELEALQVIAAQVVLALRNVSLHAQMADAAIRDPLTGLWNRRHLEVAVHRLFAARSRLDPSERRPIAAILFDLDLFGAFNKMHGHGTGDVVLRSFGQILGGRVRAGDIVARYGGEEFVAVLDGATVEQAMQVAEEVRQALESTPVEGADGTALRATVSAGCASLGPDVIEFDVLLEVADVALQMAKRAGRNQVVAA